MITAEFSMTRLNFRNLWLGALGGLAGGIPFGMMMGMMGMLPMVGMLIRVENAMVGFIVHMGISAAVGALYGHFAPAFSQTWKSATIAGVVYGMIWWVLGALILMPLMLGMTQMIFVIGQPQWMSLMGHIVYTVIMALVFKALLHKRGK
ncbi:MAG: hypothetical protein AABZ00_12825 [Chloroflexota bacterium]|jgi:uncharacterized membrane protein YagU involved in acid resistance